MAASINNLEELIKFRGKIEQSIENLNQNLKKTEVAVETVGETWKDEKFTQFEQKFSEDKELIPPLCKALTEFNDDDLHQLQQIIEEYRDVPMSRPS